jgi:3-hexulose-6-phosphate synthase
MKLQVAFDMLDLEKALSIAADFQHNIDIIEIGSLLIYKFGETAIKQFRERFPQKTILVDMKIADRGKEAARIGLNAGADWVTVLAGTSKNVIHTVCSTAHDMGKKVMLDLLDASSLGQSALESQSLGVDALLFHRPADESSPMISLEQWDIVKGNTKLPVFIAAHITRDNVHTVLELKPGGIVISVGEKETDFDDILFLSKLMKHND